MSTTEWKERGRERSRSFGSGDKREAERRVRRKRRRDVKEERRGTDQRSERKKGAKEG